MRAVRSTFLLAILLLIAFVASGAVHAQPPTLDSEIQPLVAAHKGRVAVAIKDLTTGETLALQGDEPMPTASLIKVAVMVEAYRQADAGKLDLTGMITLRDEDKVQGSGILTAHFSPGMQLSLHDAIRLMIAYSDNTATNLVLDKIGLDATAAAMEQLGLPNTKILTPRCSAATHRSFLSAANSSAWGAQRPMRCSSCWSDCTPGNSRPNRPRR
jgi:beta-lactamase class A